MHHAGMIDIPPYTYPTSTYHYESETFQSSQAHHTVIPRIIIEKLPVLNMPDNMHKIRTTPDNLSKLTGFLRDMPDEHETRLIFQRGGP